MESDRQSERKGERQRIMIVRYNVQCPMIALGRCLHRHSILHTPSTKPILSQVHRASPRPGKPDKPANRLVRRVLLNILVCRYTMDGSPSPETMTKRKNVVYTHKQGRVCRLHGLDSRGQSPTVMWAVDEVW